MRSSAYVGLRAAFDRIERTPGGPERVRAIEELRAALRALRGEELREALAEAHRVVRDFGARQPPPPRRPETRAG